MNGVLIILGGLPASGKSTLANLLAAELGAVHVRIDSIEQALRNVGVDVNGPEGYVAACAVAEDNLRLGHTVIVDSVNPIDYTRTLYRDLAAGVGARAVEVHVLCSDEIEHRQRVEGRQADIPGHKQPTWQQVVDRQFEPWAGCLVVDTAGQSVEQSLRQLSELVANRG